MSKMDDNSGIELTFKRKDYGIDMKIHVIAKDEDEIEELVKELFRNNLLKNFLENYG